MSQIDYGTARILDWLPLEEIEMKNIDRSIPFEMFTGVGGGDVKLIATLGLWLGFDLLNIVIYGTIFGGLAAILMILTKQKDRSSYFAYDPYFALTAIYFLLKNT